MSIFDWLFGKPNPRPQGRHAHLEGDGLFGFEIVGEAAYQAELAKIAGPKNAEGHEHYALAELKPELSNPHDKNAVAVRISHLTVGYLARSDAAKATAKLKKLGLYHHHLTVDAVIVGGWKRSRGRSPSEGSYGVKLDLSL
ncbi:hypothetical protein V8J36_05425 [Frigidibacter sp. MR17.14]|uniref:hypothetical protein n=1 Tax=Frigidibacter sp. MR17.14 TaxID=3126509 RepID=UPI003012E2F4